MVALTTAALGALAGDLISKGVSWVAKNPEKSLGYASKAYNTATTAGGIPLKWLGRKAKNAFTKTHGWYRKLNKTDEEKEAIDKEVEEEIEERETKAKREPSAMKQIKDAFAGDVVENHVNDFLGIDPVADDPEFRKMSQQAQALNKYAGGSAMSKVIKSVRDAEPGNWRAVDWRNMSGAAAELFSKMDQDNEGSTWNPIIGAGLNAAKTFLKANPLLGAAIDIGGVLATSQTARNAAKWLGGKVMDLGRYAYGKWTGKDIALQHNDGVIPVFSKKKQQTEEEKQEPTKKKHKKTDEPIIPINTDSSGVNIPNLMPQESKAAYMMRVTGGMNVGPANENVPTYSGHRKPQYEKVDNRVMMAPPKVVVVRTPRIRKRLRVKKKKSPKTT